MNTKSVKLTHIEGHYFWEAISELQKANFYKMEVSRQIEYIQSYLRVLYKLQSL